MNSNEPQDTEEKDQPECTEAAGTKPSDVAKSSEYADNADTGHTVERRTEGGEPPAPDEHDRNV